MFLKKLLSVCLLSVLALAGHVPAFVSAEGSGISGFDYTNYTEIEYIQSSGTQYINTGLNSTDGYNYEFKVNFQASNGAVFGRATSYRNDYFYVNSSSVAKYNCRNKDTTISTISLNTDYILRAGSVLNDSYASINNTDVSIDTNTNTITDKNVYLFAIINSQNQIASKASIKMYYGKIWNSSNQLVAYYVPAKRKSDDVLGLYDCVNSVFKTNDGSGSFTGGNPINVYYTVSTSVYPSAGGSVSGAGSYLGGSTATLTASPASGFTFSNWTDSNNNVLSSNNPINIVVSDDISITANFLPTLITNEYSISASVSPSGSGVVNGTGTYQEDATVTLTAVPASGYVFDHWSNNSTTNPLVFSASEDLSLTAYFVQESQVTTYEVSVSVDPANSGTVTGAGVLQAGTSTSLQAFPASNYQFDGWYMNDVLVSNTNPFSLLVDDDYDIVAKFSHNEVSSNWVDWTDENDREYLADISSQYSPSDFSLQVVKRLVIDDISFELVGQEFNLNYTDPVSFSGTYYDNTIMGLQACNSTTVSHTSSEIQTISNDTVYVSLDYDQNSDPISSAPYFNMGLTLGTGVITDMSGVTTSNTFQSSSQACQLMGLYEGDSAVDSLMLTSMGYEIKYLTSSNYGGVHANVAVPGNEAISFATSDLDNLLSQLESTFNKRYQYQYHYEYDVYVFPADGKILPEYGSFDSTLSMWQLLNYSRWTDLLYYESAMNEFTGERFTTLPGSQGVTSTGNFNYHLQSVDGEQVYDRNSTKLFWSDTRHPEWHFKTQQMRGTGTTVFDFYNLFDRDTYFNGLNTVNCINNFHVNSVPSDSGYYESITVNSDMVERNSHLTAGVKMYVNSISYKFYDYRDNSLLNRFNQLGSFLNSWFNKLYNSISNITGGSESNDITQNITKDFDIDVDTDINSVINNIQDRDENINLQSPDFQISNDDITGLQMLSDIPTETIKVFTDNHIAILIFIPIIFGILRLIL